MTWSLLERRRRQIDPISTSPSPIHQQEQQQQQHALRRQRPNLYIQRCYYVIGIVLIHIVWYWYQSSSLQKATNYLEIDNHNIRQHEQLQPASNLEELSNRLSGSSSSTSSTTTTSSSTTTLYERAIFLISMGKDASEMGIVERCLVSIRRRGKWMGPIVLLTDAPSDRYRALTIIGDDDDTTNHNNHNQEIESIPLTIVMHPKPEHYNWNTKQHDMPYKRFKTYVLEYLDLDERLRNVQLVYYLDVDIVIGSSLVPFFHSIETQYNITTTSTTTLSVTTNEYQQQQQRPHRLYMFQGNYPLPVQSGQLIMERYTSQNCLQRWRSLLDEHSDLILDQLSLKRLLNETILEQQQASTTTSQSQHQYLPCQIVIMEQEPYLHFPTKTTMVQMSQGRMEPLPTLIHIKNSKTAGQIQWSVQKQFFRTILRLSSIEEQQGVQFGTNNTIVDGISGGSTGSSNNNDYVRRIKIARPMVFQPSKEWSKQQQKQQR